jgi:hypothetical protein
LMRCNNSRSVRREVNAAASWSAWKLAINILRQIVLGLPRNAATAKRQIRSSQIFPTSLAKSVTIS